jgi:CubicO group peptidase (beta-lactamase class C family)
MKHSIALIWCVSLIAAAASMPAPTLQAAIDVRVAAPGTAIAVGVIDHGKVETYFAGTTGNDRPLDEHTLFEIGSVTKTFTATVLASMVLAHQVKLDDPAAAYLPKSVHVPGRDGLSITLLRLAEQRSGLPRLPSNMDDVAGTDPYADYTIPDMYAFLNSYTLPRDPGATYEYSNYGIGLLGQLLANRANETYQALVAQRVLAPLGMTDTTFATVPASDPPTLAVGHDLGGQPVASWHLQAILPAGGIRSSLADMLRYLRCNLGQGPLAAACLFAQQARAAGPPGHRIGLVWETSVFRGSVSHGGDTAGYHAFVAISKDRQSGVVALSNGPLVTDVATHALFPEYPIAQCPASVPADEAGRSSYAGVYCSAIAGLVFTVASGKNPVSLSIALLPQHAFEAVRTDTDAYANAKAGTNFQFARRNGDIVGLYLIQGGEAIPAMRLDVHGKPFTAQLPPAFPPVVSLDDATLQQYVGTYTGAFGTITVTLRGAGLYVQLTGQPAAPVYASAKDAFFYKIVAAQIRFTRDPTGKITSLTLHQNGANVQATRTAP